MSYVHDAVTTKLLEQLEAGVIPWRQRWRVTGSAGMPRNFITDRPYTGINVLLLWLTGLEAGYSDKRWLTANQIKQLGGNFRGQHASRIIFAGQGKRQNDNGEEASYTCIRFYNVFNAEQVGGVDLSPESELEPFELRLKNVRGFVESQGVPIVHGGDRAFYSPSRDVITLPHPTSFFDEESYWATTLHELAHATGHSSRLDRPFGKKCTPEYALEELVAELASCFVFAELGITPMFEDSASYLEYWCQLLGDSKTAIFRAARDASKVTAYLQAHAVPRAVAA